MNCLACGLPVIAAGHRLVLPDQSMVAWHPDCHARSSVNCPLCANVVAAYPDLKDEALGEAIMANNPNAPKES